MRPWSLHTSNVYHSQNSNQKPTSHSSSFTTITSPQCLLKSEILVQKSDSDLYATNVCTIDLHFSSMTLHTLERLLGNGPESLIAWSKQRQISIPVLQIDTPDSLRKDRVAGRGLWLQLSENGRGEGAVGPTQLPWGSHWTLHEPEIPS